MTVSAPSRAVTMTAELVRCASVTPADDGALGLIEAWLKPYGFEIHRPVFQTEGHYAVENLYARIGSGTPCLVFAGHTDVVPPGDVAGWSRAPFSGEIAEGAVWGRGASDMKSGVAAALAAVLDHLDQHGAPQKGSIAFLITGDEEADAVDGTVRLLEWAKARGEVFSACVLGEPTNPQTMGDMVKIGRRGSLSGDLHVEGVQGHVAYPDLARNPIDGLMRLMAALKEPLDAGTPHFLPSNLEFTALDCGNPARNVIPARAGAKFNIRFNDLWTSETLGAELRRRLAGVNDAPRYELTLLPTNAEAFLTEPGPFVELVAAAVEAETGRRPVLSTTGGTSDARFIQAYCPVVEFGVVGKTMHKVNENAAIADIDCLKAVYGRVIDRFLGV
ncbi:MAG: succinyl-diaminopimelate desuccinylase [Beijerinckiaceae bacterium]|jgi:succinyl-diaminopimelate desuccinylase|nr:succinyl-diaminopimelate desuccinylase [Beijerinckiaceae bacterium]